MRFQKGRKVDWSKKSGPFFVPSPQIGINGGCREQQTLTDTPNFDVFQVLNGYLWWYSLGGIQCVHAARGPWGLMS